MYSIVSEKFNNLNWEYLEITDSIINSRYNWVRISFPNENKKFPWAHEYNIIRLFLYCRTFGSKKEALNSIKHNLNLKMSTTHLELLDTFCYSELEIIQSIDELIEYIEFSNLLSFIHLVLDGSLL